MSIDQVQDDLSSPENKRDGASPLNAVRDIHAEKKGEMLRTIDQRRILWQPNPEKIAQSNIVAFLRFLEEHYGSEAPTMDRLYEWSIEYPEKFWQSFLWFSNISYVGDDRRVLTYAPHPTAPLPHSGLRASGPRTANPLPRGEGKRMIDAQWFPDIRLNFAENLLHTAEENPQKEAIAFFGEDRVERHLTYGDLRRDAVRFSHMLDACSVERGDRVVALMPNIPEAVSAMLATTARGALWSSISPEFGADTVVDRFGQLNPKVLIAADGHLYRGKAHSTLPKVQDILQQIPAIEQTILVPYVWPKGSPDLTHCTNAHVYGSTKPNTGSAHHETPSPKTLFYDRLPFNHPLFVLFSSGTEGKPKCVVHGAGGTLLNQLKQHLLHTDLRTNDTFFFNTRTSWMMWNSLVCALGAGAKIVLYDGDPLAREGKILFDIAEKEHVTTFGTSAGFLAKIEEMGLRPQSTHDLSSLRTILSTGSTLHGPQFDYVYAHVHSTAQLASTSGGTEILGAFATASPVLPVHREELQTRSLGYKVEIFDEQGKSVPHGMRGELVCTAPFPSQPVGFWNDPGDERYLATYFTKYGPTVWRHGDEAEITPSEGMVIHGRSDDTLKRGGVRMGPAEITMQAQKVPEVLEAVAVGQKYGMDEHILLFVILKEGHELTEELKSRIRSQIRSGASPYHVPDIILSVPDLPRTRNGKLSASAIRSTVHGAEVKNIDALANPEALDYVRNRPELRV